MIGGRIDPEGNLSARMMREITPKLHSSVEVQVSILFVNFSPKKYLR
jgi:hypothetical protein